MKIPMFDWIGWVATATFAISYFCKQPSTLRRLQALASLLWMVYGAIMHSLPMVVANILVAAIAGYSSFRPDSARRLENAPGE